MNLNGRNIFISGASRGIGLAIAKRCAADGARIAIAAKTTEPNPKLPGTIYSAAQEIEAAGGQCLPLQVDIRDEQQVVDAARVTAEKFGGIDILINNASAISLTPTEATPMKRFDLMFGVNVRGTYLCSQTCIPHLRESAKAGRNPHILTLSPPLNMNPRWFKNHVAYTMAKYGMSMCVLGMAEELRADGIAVNALWPRTVIKTAALAMLPGVDTQMCRTPEILADAAHVVLNRDARRHTGHFYLDEEVLAAEGVTDLGRYAVLPGNNKFLPDLFLDS